MKDQDKSTEQMICELNSLRKKITELETIIENGSVSGNASEFEVRRKRSAVDGQVFKESKLSSEDIFSKNRDMDEISWSLLNCSPDPIILYDVEGKVQYLNPAHSKLFGWTLEEAQGKRLNTLPDWDREATLSIIHQILTDGAMNQSYDTQRLSKQGQLIDVSLSGARFLDHNGNPAGMLVILHDITERKLAENELRQSEARFRSYFELPLIGIAITSVDKNWLDVNSTLCDMLGYSRQELLRMTWTQLTHPDDLDADLAQFNRMLAGKIDNYSLEKRFIRKDGDIVWVNLSIGCVRKPDGAADYVVALLQNVTLRKKAEEALKASEERYRQLADVAFEGIVFHEEGVLLDANDQFFKMFGYEPGELVGTPIIEKTLTPESVQTVRAHIDQRSAESYLVTGLRKDGSTLPIEVRGRMREVGGKMVRATAIRDITDLRNLESQLFQSQKLEALGTLVGGIAHDFNNMLQVIIGYSEVLLSDKAKTELCRNELRTIIETAEGGAELVKKLLAFGQQAPIFPVNLDLNHHISQMTSLISRTLPPVVQIDLDLQEGPTTIHADPNQIDQMLMNLAINAAEAMPDGGRLKIETRNVTFNGEYCRICNGLKQGSYVTLSVRDTGRGMDKETLSRIFEPFFSTKQRGSTRGTGLGLSVVQGIAQQHGGHLDCASEPGKGTEFRIYFPAAEEPLVAVTNFAPAVQSGGSETILIVEDSMPVAQLEERFFTGAGYNVIVATNGRQALDIFRSRKEEISLVILDLIMPEMSGRDCLMEMTRIDPSVKVLIASGYSPGDELHKEIRPLVRGFLQKPFAMTDLLDQARVALNRS